VNLARKYSTDTLPSDLVHNNNKNNIIKRAARSIFKTRYADKFYLKKIYIKVESHRVRGNKN
jgi:hypothetical protein